MVVLEDVMSVVIMIIILLAGGIFITHKQAAGVSSLVAHSQQEYIKDAREQALDTALQITESQSNKSLGRLIALQMHQKRQLVNASGRLVNVTAAVKSALDQIYGDGNYYFQANPEIIDVNINFILDGSNSFRAARKELVENMPDIIKSAGNRKVRTFVYIITKENRCKDFNDRFAELGMTNSGCSEINGEIVGGDVYLPEHASLSDYRKVFNVTRPYNFPGKPDTARRDLDYYEADWAAGLAHAESKFKKIRLSELNIFFPIGDELSTSSFADSCFVTDYSQFGLDDGDRILCDLCEPSCPGKAEERSLAAAEAAAKMADEYGHIVNPVYAYSCSYYSPQANSSYADNWKYWNIVYKAKKGLDIADGKSLCDDPGCAACQSLDGTYNSVCPHQECRSAIMRHMELIANRSNGKVINLSDPIDLSGSIAGAVADNINMMTISIGKKRTEGRFAYERKVLLPSGSDFVTIKLWVYK